MDTSEQNIRMLVQAWPDIGEVLRDAGGVTENLYYCTKHRCLIEKDEDGCPKCYGKKGNERPCDYDKDGGSWWIIIPRQDQLQEMLIGSEYRDWKNLLSFFFDWVDWDALDKHGSMERLWLSFVMQESYNKVWNGEDWKEEASG